MSYTKEIKIVIPANLYSIACSIARAMDPDVGGFYSFGSAEKTDSEGNPYYPDEYETTFPCTTSFYESAMVLLKDAALLHQQVVADYSSRWPEYTPPSLEECISFTNNVKVF